jgi:uncharacterized protein (TIGR02217 family)
MSNELTLKPDYTFNESPQYETIISQFENGAEQRRAKRSSAVIEYKLVYKNRSQVDLDTILALFNAKKGALTSFTWTHPISGSTLTVRFKEDSFSYTNVSYRLYNFEFSLVTII